MKKIKSRKLKMKNRKVVRFLFVLFCFLGFLFCNINVNAGMNDSVLVRNRVDNIYAVANVNGVDRIFYLNMYEMNGKVAYCIDLGVDITSYIYHSTNDFNISYLSSEKIQYIQAVSYFGYGYFEHNDKYYYMAAQELIWEYLSEDKVNVEWSFEMKVDGSRIDIDFYKEEILRLIDLENKRIDFDGDDGRVYKVGSEFVLEDKNGILDKYEVVSSKYSDVVIDGNRLVFKVGNVMGEDVIKLKRKDFYEYDSLLYYYDNSQRLISSGNYNDDVEEIKFNVEGVDLDVSVIDMNTGTNIPLGEATLEGSVFDLYNIKDEFLGTYVTDEKGKFKVCDLLLGSYYFKNPKVSEGYLRYGGKINVDIGSKENKLKIEQTVISNAIEINKVFGSNGMYEAEVGVNFYLYDSFGNVIGNMRTNAQGRISLNLPYGTYKVSQITTTYGYSKVVDFIIEVRQQNYDKIYYNLVNELISVKVRVNTLAGDSFDNLKMEGFSYKIRSLSEDKYLDFDGNDVFTTNSDGELLIPINLLYGDYVLEQVDVPSGILLNEEKLIFSINDNSQLSLVGNDLVMNILFYNELVKGKVNVIAMEERFNRDINYYWYDNVVKGDNGFVLVAGEDIIVNGIIMYNAGDKVSYGKTDANGEISFDNLYLGSYCLIDEVTNEKICFEMIDIDNKTKIVEENIEFIKQLPKGSIIIENVDSSGLFIVDSVFEVLDKNGLVVYTGITNENGIIKIEDIVSGEYCIKQKKVGLGYQMLDNNKECFLLEDEKKINFVNKINKMDVVVVPNTLTEDIGFYGALVVLFLIGTGYVVYKKIFASKLYP